MKNLKDKIHFILLVLNGLIVSGFLLAGLAYKFKSILERWCLNMNKTQRASLLGFLAVANLTLGSINLSWGSLLGIFNVLVGALLIFSTWIIYNR